MSTTTEETGKTAKVLHWYDGIVCAFTSNLMAVEMQGAVTIISLGAWMMFAGMFASCPQVYWVMQGVLNEKLWGGIFMAVGLLQITVLTLGNIAMRKSVLLIKGALWTTLFVTVLYGDWRAPGVPLYLIFAVSAFRTYLCLRKSQ
jgi:hypothetical protein